MDVDLEELAAIIELLDQTNFTHFQFEKGDLRISVTRGTSGGPAPEPAGAATTATGTTVSGSESVRNGTESGATTAQESPAATAEPGPAPPSRSDEPSAGTAHEGPSLAEQPLQADEVLVRAPMLGCFYRSPKPGDPPFVTVGDKVEEDTVVCIVEVMKLMNSVVAGVRGEVTRVLAGNGELVEAEQPLFAVRVLP